MAQVFWIVGCERSGTTLARAILSRSPELSVHLIEPHYVLDLYHRFGMEVDDVPAAVSLLAGHRKFPVDAFLRATGADAATWQAALFDLFKGAARLPLRDMVLRIWNTVHDLEATGRLVLKHPEFVRHLDTLQALFPNVRVVNMIRDPRSAVASSLVRWPARSLIWRCRRWNSAVAAAEAWEKRYPERILTVRYEDLVSNSEKTLHRLCGFLEIELRDEMLTPHEDQEQGAQHDGASPHGPIDASRIEAWQQRLTPEQVRFIESRCASFMPSYGYFADFRPVRRQALRIVAARDRARYVRDLLSYAIRHVVSQKLVRTNETLPDRLGPDQRALS